MRIGGKWLAVVAGSLALAACWTSDEPLIEVKDAEMPTVAGTWKSDDGGWLELKADPAKREYAALVWSDDNPTRTTETLMLDELGEGWYIIQSVDMGGLRGYEVAHVGDGMVAIHTPPCDAEFDLIDDVMFTVGGDCHFSKLAALKTAGRVVVEREKDFPSTAKVTWRRQ